MRRDGLKLRLSDPSPSASFHTSDSEEESSERGSRSSRSGTDDSSLPGVVQTAQDTRTHVVVELYETEKSYVDSLDILVKKYLQPLKSPENAGLLDSFLVDEIFYQVPAILGLHQAFLEQLRRRLEHWDLQQKVGDVFLEVFTKPMVMDTYMSFINNLRRARETIKAAASSRPAFARFLDAMARDHKGKLSLDNLLIKPVQKFPSYKLLIQRLIKHTDQSHPDHKLLLEAQKEIHEVLEVMNCTERESVEQEAAQAALRELEVLVEGLSGLASSDRSLLRCDSVTVPAAPAAPAAPHLMKDRALFLLNDTLLITSVKRRTGTIKKPLPTYQSNIASLMEGTKHKLLMRIPLADLEIVKAKDENLRRAMQEVEWLRQDVATLTRVVEQVGSLRLPHPPLHDAARDALATAARLLRDRRAAGDGDGPPEGEGGARDGEGGALCRTELSVNTANGPENLTIIFPKPEKRSSWEELVNETKQKLYACGGEPEFLSPVPIRKTRAGLQFTCAAPTAPPPGQPPDVWVCNSDGYVGQVCVVSLSPRPQVSSCNGVCNARILCVACVPPAHHAAAPPAQTGSISLNSTSSAKPGISISGPNDSCKNIRLDSSSSSDDEDEASSASSAEPDRRGEDRRTETSRTTGAIGTTGASGNTGPTGNVGALGMRGTIGSGSGSGTLVPSHAKSLSAPAPPPPLHPVTKSNSNPAVDKHMAIATGTLSSPASRQSSEDAGASAASAGAGASAAAAAAGGSMWLGTEDGAIHVYSCLDSIRLKKNKLKMQHSAPVHAIVYVEGKVFVALGNGDVVVYCRDIDGAWAERCTLGVGGGAAVGGLLLAAGRVWCAAHTALHVLNPRTMQIEETFQISTESKPISHIAVSGGAVWVALHNAAQLRAYRASSRDLLADINLTPLVTRMLHGCDDIIRQHKAACLRVTALAAHSGTLWVGTSAGVLLTAPLHHAPHPRTGAFTTPALTGIPYGHTGHVRFLTIVENPAPARPQPKTSQSSLRAKAMSRRSALADKRDPPPTKETLVISGGDGYEDFRSSGSNEDAGREDSTNHLLLWRV